MTEGLNEARSFAWQLAATKDSTAGPRLAPDSFGHLGFTGTSCWIDPTRDAIFILLTNRTHARALPFANINSVRRQFHTLPEALARYTRIMLVVRGGSRSALLDSDTRSIRLRLALGNGPRARRLPKISTVCARASRTSSD